MENIDEMVLISPHSKVRVVWSDQPHNYSKENKNKIKNYFANKYGVNKNNINVIYKPVKLNEKGEVIEVEGAGIDNIMDINYQRALMKELVTRENKNVDFDRLIALDDIINSELTVDLTAPNHKNWAIKWIMIDNFLSFGEKNYVPFNKFNGLTIVNSLPENQGGKTTLTVDTVKFLLHGNTTKTDKNEEIFNSFSDKNELVVRGMIDIEGEELIIERKMRRSAKKEGGWTVVNKVNYYKILPDGEEEELNEEDAKQTTKKLKESIGTEKDFEMLVLATEKNLDDLIGLTTTESGKILTRLIGLEVLEMKEKIVREKYNEFNKKKKSNMYDIITLSQEIDDHKNKISECKTLESELNEKLDTAKKGIQTLTTEKEDLINRKEKIDVSISELNPERLESDIEALTKKGIEFKKANEEINKKIDEIGVVDFDEDTHHELTKKLNTTKTNKALKEAEVTRLEKVIEDLIAGGICQSCNRKLDDVDNTEHIENHKLEINKITDELKVIEKEISTLTKTIDALNVKKSLVDEKNKLELSRDKNEVEMASLRNDIKEKNNDLKKYKLNLKAIDLNKTIDIEISNVKTKLNVLEYSKDDLITKIERVQNDEKSNATEITTKEKLIETIKKEEDVEKIFKLYIELVGKKGISKLVLRSVLPIINSEAQRLLEDVCDFEIEIFMDDKNDVQFLLIKDGITKLLKSGSGFERTAASLVLRCVLGKISTLPMPNFIAFDEVLGKVAPDNLEKLKTLFDKIKDMYEIVFLITHNDLVKDWSDNVITVVKENNISKATFN